MTKHSTACAVLLSVFLLSVPGVTAHGATYHVATDGDDGNSGKTVENAFATIQRGLEPLEPGDTLVVQPGTYRQTVTFTPEHSGERDNPITIRAAIPGRTRLVGSVRLTDWAPVRGRRQVFRAPLQQHTDLVYEKDTGTEYTELANLARVERQAGSFLYDADEGALYVHPSDELGMQHHVIDASVIENGFFTRKPPASREHKDRIVGIHIEGFVVTGYSGYGIFLRNADDCVIRNCIAHHCRGGIIVYEAVRPKILNCEAFACHDRYNRELGNIALMGKFYEGVLANNVVHDTDSNGIRLYGALYGSVMRNNLAYNCHRGMQVKGHPITPKRAKYHTRYSYGGDAGLKDDPTVLVEHNVSHRNIGGGLVPTHAFARFNTIVRDSFERADRTRSNISLQPDQVPHAGVADPAWHDFRLQSDSPHMNAGRKGETPGAHPYNGEVVYVGPEGDDTAAGTSIERAWRTLSHACEQLEPGQTLYLLPGTYAEPIGLSGLRATPDQPTTLRAHGKRRVVLDGQGEHGAIELRNCEHVRIQGLRITNTPDAAVRVADSTHVRFEQNRVYDNAGDGLTFTGDSTGARVIRNTIAYNGGAGVRLGGGAAGTWLLSNIVRQNQPQIALPKGTPDTLYSDYNNLGGGVIATFADSTADSLGMWRSSTRQDRSSIDTNPRFIDAAARDFRLRATSLCRARGYLNRTIGAAEVAPSEQNQPLSFDQIRTVNTTRTSADLAWFTRGGKSTVIIKYGTAPDNLQHKIVRDTGHFYRTRHLFTLRDLKPGQRYYFRVGYRDLVNTPEPFHNYRYTWPSRTPKGERERYESLEKQDTYATEFGTFTTRTSQPSGGRTYHVATDGADSAPGTADQPFETLKRAARVAGPSDTVIVHEGTYQETIRPLRSGAEGSPITFRAAKGERVVIDGQKMLIPHAVDLQNRDHINIRGFFFQWQTEKRPHRGGFGQVSMVNASHVRVEQCVFDGRANYVNGMQVYDGHDITVRNNIFVSHHVGMILHDNRGTVRITDNTFLGPTINKIYGPRNEDMIVKRNFFGENLFPKKKMQYRVKISLVKDVEADHNVYYVNPANDERRLIDYTPITEDVGSITARPEQQKGNFRIGVKKTLALWRKRTGQGVHSLVTTDPKWANPDLIEQVRSRPSGWPRRDYEYEPFTRNALRVAEDSPCRGAGPDGGDIGADYSY